jgi:hypothetical protein
MTSHNAANERIKCRYFAYLAEALGQSEQSIDAVAKAIARFEAYTKWRDFKRFHIEQARGFKHSLADQRGRLALLGGQICKSPEEYKAWSQNLGHENVLTTFSSYGDVARHRQAEIIRSLGKSEQHACISSSSLIVLPAKGIFDGATS